ncbi:Fe(3+)-hydroxamate ABC transporter permease FhuB [Roseibium sp. RKSG952]|uniref:Fe(3+)-hydroxamate ABC transporter permease FhuB n=1 Tax=Roseibium sp. RKSG952 TaxID=2529384 RepID=UPI0012BBBC73|nr:Fe(3+)-hydroxamate ABC transporter permease FhuB [Roseibium sp. RKSG952]MTH95637.1 Fe(3+)-hydroxamate ABC transporter permease FhuB [Roseibium sp. RKSG952]
MSVHVLTNRAPWLSAGLFAGAGSLCWLLIAQYLPLLGGISESYDVERMIALYAVLPRMATALLCGAALSLSGVLLQIALRNPLASPTTLGVSAGAHLALVLATLIAPALIALSRDAVALAGSLTAAALVFALVSRRSFSPVTLVLAGLVVSLYFGAAATLLVLLNDRYLVSLFIWGAGSLSQQDWSIPATLAPKLLILSVIAGFLVRPLNVLNAGDETAIALGAKPGRLRALTVGLAVALAAFVTSSVGVIGFVGLAAPALARLAGARTIASQMLWSTLIGSALLFFTDNAIQLLAGPLSNFVPTGAVTALFGSPLLLLLLRKTKSLQATAPRGEPVKRWSQPPVLTAVGGALLLALVIAASITFGRTFAGGWDWIVANPAPDMLLQLRGPRVLSAALAGALLAVAGVILQRLSGNDMASPEVLGVSSGAMLGLAFGVFFLSPDQTGSLIGFASLGAIAIMGLILMMNRKSGFQAERMVLAGIALTALLDALIGALAATGDLRALLLLRWMSGSTYGASTSSVAALGLSAGLLLVAALALARWINLLDLGGGPASALGVPVRRARAVLFLIAGLMTAAATLSVGPLSFIGLMAPHIARQLGFSGAHSQILTSAAAGAGLMVVADWIGRYGYFPYEMPAGLISALVGTPFLMLLLSRKAS